MPLFHSTHHLVSAACLFVFMLIISQTGATDKAQVKQQSFDIDNIYDDSAFSNYEIHPELTDSVISDENEIDETNDFKFINITENQSYLYNRIKSSKYVNNPYKNLNISQICIGTSSLFSSGRNDYNKLRTIYANCVYVDGNFEISNFNPYYRERTNDNGEIDEYYEDPEDNEDDAKLDATYDFSFLDTIKEITGYLLIHNTRVKTLRFKNLQLIRGNSLISNKYSVYIDSNVRLQHLDLVNLREIQKGSVYILNNPRLCHMDDVIWNDIILNKPPYSQEHFIENNADHQCPSCKSSCCSSTNNSLVPMSGMIESCGCWFPNGCQKLSKVTCNPRCQGRCYGPGPFDCCNTECLGGCFGPNINDCIACKNLRITETGECVKSCPRIQMADPITGDLYYNPEGLYQYGITCVKECPQNMFIYREFCMNKCTNKTYEDEELILNPETGEKGMRRMCKTCTAEKCPKSCSIEKIKQGELTFKSLKYLEGCEVLNSNLLILQPDEHLNDPNLNLPPELTEQDLQVLSSIRVINGFVRIQSNKIKSLSFLRNLEVIRASNLAVSKYAMIILSKSLKTLGLNRLRRIEKGEVLLKTDSLCLGETIDWHTIIQRKNAFLLSQNESYTKECQKDGYVCDPGCKGCWSMDARSCQFCKSYKLTDICIERCQAGDIINKSYVYLENRETRECKFCHPECVSGCNGPTEFDCFACKNFSLEINSTAIRCLDKCPVTHYADLGMRTCLPCFENCYGCTGPREVIAPDGCTRCASALVDSDHAYSILQCIQRDEFNCSTDHFYDLVPPYLKTHPLRGKAVCRKCHQECENCFQNGAMLHTQCERCRHYYSKSTNECVNDCSYHNEYLEADTKNCQPCNSECKLGCTGSNNYECKECRSFRIHFADVRRIVEEMVAQKYDISQSRSQHSDLSDNQIQVDQSAKLLDDLIQANAHALNQSNTSGTMKDNKLENLIELIKHYKEYHLRREYTVNSESNSSKIEVVFCINECPLMMPYQTMDLFCTKDKLTVSHNNFFVLLIVLSVLVICILLGSSIFSGLLLRYLDRRNKEKLRYEQKFFSLEDSSGDEDGGEKKTVNMAELRLIQINDLEKSFELGKGAFGTVYEGNYVAIDKNGKKFKIKVAIKELNKCKSNDEKDCKELTMEIINEAKVMASVNHKYCLQLSALCLAEPIMMISQLMRFGSVVSFMQKYRESVNEKMLLMWAQQIAEGMNYLESRAIVHRDLAARNILVKSYDHIKITDFGLAKILDKSEEEGFYAKANSLVPVKWMAIESIRSRLFTHWSDVWSYGVCLWEIFTFCAKPYAELEQLEVISSIIKGVRLARPPIASIDVYTILLRCWLEKPYTRPSFKELSDEFEKMCIEPKLYLSLKDVDTSKKFRTISESTHELIKNFHSDENEKQEDKDDLDQEKDKNKTHSKSNKSKPRRFSLSRSHSQSKKHNSLSPDEGIDLNSTEMTSATTVGEVYTTSSDSSLNNIASAEINGNKINRNLSTGANRNNNYVITFKRSPPKQTEMLANKNVKSNSLNAKIGNRLHNTLITAANADAHDGLVSIAKRPSNLGFLKNFLFNTNRAISNSKRLNSQASTATGSTYVSTAYSDISTSTHSPRIILPSPNNYEEQQTLISNASRSNSNSSSCSNSFDSNRSIYNAHNIAALRNHFHRQNSRRKSSNNTNSDYLEPVTHNIKENMEYFGDTSGVHKPIKSIIIMPDPEKDSKETPLIKTQNQRGRNTRNYYNDDIAMALLFEQQKQHHAELQKEQYDEV